MALVRGFNWMIVNYLAGISGTTIRNENDKKRILFEGAQSYWASHGSPPQTINDKLRTYLRWVWATNEPVVPGQRPIAATPGSPGSWLPYSSEPPASGDLDGITPIPSSAWPPGTWIVTSDGALVRWNGSGWTVATASLLYQALVLSQNPIGYWRLNEASGTVAADLSVNANAGAYTNAPILDIPAIAGSTGMGKDGTVQQGAMVPVIPAYANALAANATPYSVEAWFRGSLPPPDESVPLLFWAQYWSETEASEPIELSVANSSVNGPMISVIASYSSPTVMGGIVWGVLTAAAAAIFDGAWHLLTFTMDNAAQHAQLYIDGVLAYEESGFTAVPVMPPPTNKLTLGTFDVGPFALPEPAGEIDEVAIYPSVQTAAAIAARYALGSPAAPPVDNYETVVLADNPFGYWRLDDLAGSVAADLGSGGQPAEYLNGTDPGDVALWVPRTPAAVASGLAVTPLFASSIRMVPGVFGALDFSCELWFQWNAAVAGAGYLVNAIGPGQINLQIIWNPGGSLAAHRWPPGGSLVTLTAPATAQDVWHHVVYRRITGVSLSLWVDGVQVATAADPAGFGPANAITVGGDVTGTNFVHGMIDEVAFYQHALTAPQIAAHYAARL